MAVLLHGVGPFLERAGHVRLDLVAQVGGDTRAGVPADAVVDRPLAGHDLVEDVVLEPVQVAVGRFLVAPDRSQRRDQAARRVPAVGAAAAGGRRGRGPRRGGRGRPGGGRGRPGRRAGGPARRGGAGGGRRPGGGRGAGGPAGRGGGRAAAAGAAVAGHAVHRERRRHRVAAGPGGDEPGAHRCPGGEGGAPGRRGRGDVRAGLAEVGPPALAQLLARPERERQRPAAPGVAGVRDLDVSLEAAGPGPGDRVADRAGDGRLRLRQPEQVAPGHRGEHRDRSEDSGT